MSRICKHHHDLLLANCLAQSEALMKGRTLEEAQRADAGQGHEAGRCRARSRRTASSPATGPSVTILYSKLDPHTLGRLIALYEHRVFVEGALFDINSFDQWGVELGKELATGLLPVVEGKEDAAKHDASTAGLVRTSSSDLRGAELRQILADIKGILFDKDGTLVDFQQTWFAHRRPAWRCRRRTATARGPTR